MSASPSLLDTNRPAKLLALSASDQVSGGRTLALAMPSKVDTANWSDRAIARAAGVSPTTVGALRRTVCDQQVQE